MIASLITVSVLIAGMIGTAMMALGAVLAPGAAWSSAEALRVSFEEGQLTVEAENASLDRILDTVAARVGFAVARSGSLYRPPLITGRKTGSPGDILAWLLSIPRHSQVKKTAHNSNEQCFPGPIRPAQVLAFEIP